MSSNTTDQHIYEKLSQFGDIARVLVFHGDLAGKQQGHKGTSWAKVSFKEPAQAAAAVAAAGQLIPWVVKGSRPAPLEHTFVQVGYDELT